VCVCVCVFYVHTKAFLASYLVRSGTTGLTAFSRNISSFIENKHC